MISLKSLDNNLLKLVSYSIMTFLVIFICGYLIFNNKKGKEINKIVCFAVVFTLICVVVFKKNNDDKLSEGFNDNINDNVNVIITSETSNSDYSNTEAPVNIKFSFDGYNWSDEQVYFNQTAKSQINEKTFSLEEKPIKVRFIVTPSQDGWATNYISVKINDEEPIILVSEQDEEFWLDGNGVYPYKDFDLVDNKVLDTLDPLELEENDGEEIDTTVFDIKSPQPLSKGFEFSNKNELVNILMQWHSNKDNLRLVYGDISNWDVSEVKDMSELFFNQTYFNEDISNWDVSNVENMESMFQNAESFNQDISKWDTHNVKNMRNMFRGASSFNQDVNTKIVQIFNNKKVAWDLSSVSNMNSMFRNASNFNKNLDKWNTKNVSDMIGLFYGASKFNQNICSWDLSNLYHHHSDIYYNSGMNQLNKKNIGTCVDPEKLLNYQDYLPINENSLIEEEIVDLETIYSKNKTIEEETNINNNKNNNNKPISSKKVLVLDEGILQSELKGVGNIFAPRIIVKNKDESNRVRTNTTNIEQAKTIAAINSKDNSGDSNDSCEDYKKPKEVNFGNFNKCSTKVKCYDPKIDDTIEDNLKEKSIYPGYTYMPPSNWEGGGEKTPNCAVQRKCLNKPPSLNNSYPHPHEYSGVGSILPRFSFKQEYEYDSTCPAIITGKEEQIEES